MSRSVLEQIDQRVIALYDDFTHRHLDRRLFLERLSALVGSGALATSMMALLRSNYALAAVVSADDPRLVTERLTYPGASGPVKAYLARPKGAEKLPAIVVIHQNRGLNPHIEDIARRLALQNYVALAPDFMSPLGGTPADEDEAMKEFAQVKPELAAADAAKAVLYLESRADVTGKIGAVGFCWGGGGINRLATLAPDLAAAVAFYGIAPPLDQVPNIKAALLLNYAGARRPRERDAARLRRGAEESPRELSGLYVRGRQPRLLRRHQRGALQRGSGQARVAAHARVPRAKTQGVSGSA